MQGALLRNLLTIITATWLLFIAGVCHANPQVYKLSYNNQGSSFILKLNMDAAANYHSFPLQNPNRFVIDIQGVSWQARIPSIKPILHAINNIRIGYQAHHTLRVVLDMQPGWNARTINNKSFPQTISIILSRQKKNNAISPQSRLQTAAQPIRLQPINTHPAAKTKTSRKKIVVIDPGHGGKDPGAIGRRGYREKNIVLQIAKRIAKNINATPNYRAVLTRSRDRYLPLRKRLAIARRAHADLFVSIHADAYKNRHSRGASVFALSQRGATSEAARWLADKENASEIMGGIKLQDKTKLLKSVLINLSQTAAIHDSLRAGQNITKAIARVTKLHRGHVEQAAFVVLKSPDIPSLLVETGFISNRYEERLLASPRFQRKLANAIASGITRYFKQRQLWDTRLR